MKLTQEQVEKVAKLANLPISAEEASLYTVQLSKFIEYTEKLDSVDTTSIEPTFNVSPDKNIMHPDEAKECLSPDEALQNAPKKSDGKFVTKGVFSGE